MRTPALLAVAAIGLVGCSSAGHGPAALSSIVAVAAAASPAAPSPAVPSPAGANPAAASQSSPSSTMPSAAAPSAAGATYADPRYGFTAVVPAGFTAGQPAVDGDGRQFGSPDGSADYTVSGSVNAHGDSAASLLALQEQNYRDRGYSLSYTNRTGNVVTVSGTRGDSLVYDREVVGSKFLDSLVWTYRVADKPRYDPVLESTVAGYRAGPVD